MLTHNLGQQHLRSFLDRFEGSARFSVTTERTGWKRTVYELVHRDEHKVLVTIDMMSDTYQSSHITLSCLSAPFISEFDLLNQ